MKRRMNLGAVIAVALAPALATAADPPEKLKTFYFGNSYLENSMVGFHPILGKTAGRTWEVSALIHPGVPIWVHAVRQTEPDSANYKQFHQEGPAVDAIVMLQFAGMGLKYVTADIWEGKFKFDPPRDVGDIESCATIVREYLKMNPKGRAYVYTAWPSSPELREFRKRVEEEQKRSAENRDADRGEVMQKVKAKVEISDDAIEPILERFDFAEAWMAKDYVFEYTPPEMRARYGKYGGCIMRNARDKTWKPTLAALAEAAATTEEAVQKDLAALKLDIDQLRAAADPRAMLARGMGEAYRTHSQPHDYALLDGLKKEFPEMWKDGRLGMIPVGDVMMALDKKIKTGTMLPLKSVGQLAPGHMRSGLGRYMLGATFYAVLFRDHPKNLDAAIYANRDNYINKDHPQYPKLNIIGGFYVHEPDLGRHIEITPERKKIMDETIWAVVNGHPYTQVKE
jgi:hypothetical protein